MVNHRCIMVKCFQKSLSALLGFFFVHFDDPGTSTDFCVKSMRDHVKFELDFVEEFGWEEGFEE